MFTKIDEPAKAIARDDRGAVLVMGIFMCTCLVGALWYLAAIGDSILYRERLQEASDAVVFSNAVLHARGMNLIVLINLIMACVLAIRVALKVTQIVLAIAAAVFFVIGIFAEPFLAAAGGCVDGIEAVEDLINETREPINDTLKALSSLQTVIAKATPGAAEVGAVASVGEKYKPVASQTLVLDESIVTGLPVTRGTESKLCEEAGSAVVGTLEWLLHKIHLDAFDEATGWLRDAMKALAGAAPGFFCEMGTVGTSPDGAIDGLLGESAQDRCDKGGPPGQYDVAEIRWEEACREANVVCDGGDSAGPHAGQKVKEMGEQKGTTTPEKQQELDTLRKQRDSAAKSANQYVDAFGTKTPDSNQCQAWARDAAKTEMKKRMEKGAQKNEQGNQNTQDMTGKQVKSDWFNGGPDGQLVGGALGDPSRLQRSVDLVRVGGMKKPQGANGDVPVGARLPAWTQAEFFYDCAGPWKTCNDDEDAMWHLQWRARLRRYDGSKPVDRLGELFSLGVSLQQGATGLSSLVSNPGFSQSPNALPGNAALIVELGATMADKENVLRGIH